MQNKWMQNKMGVAVILILGLFLILPAGIFAAAPSQETGNLEGVIFKSDGKTPLKNAQLILEEVVKGDKTGKEYKSNITDETGEYKLEDIPVGIYKGKIMLNSKRYKIKRVDFYFHVFPGETNNVSFSLKKK